MLPVVGASEPGRTSRGAPRLCSAIDTAFLQEIKNLFAKSKSKLVSLQPELMATFNRWRGKVR